ncbi:hypothetical protein M422DRAFT_51068 [Sphaerobolus stellatus SS14]|uniref:F-box domain-containing protein n=1 Tax=Sphaerobolus stellatus (strain SS14) TaxID=990650 RepID=A0A0C9UNR9_SPHS4|nr:hypothetical protein M422DRAFT_51068 [Sphaerobolus stellatus SS14]
MDRQTPDLLFNWEDEDFDRYEPEEIAFFQSLKAQWSQLEMHKVAHEELEAHAWATGTEVTYSGVFDPHFNPTHSAAYDYKRPSSHEGPSISPPLSNSDPSLLNKTTLLELGSPFQINASNSAASLPTEILSRIFIYALNGTHPPRSPCQRCTNRDSLSAVCSEWCLAALNTPELWIESEIKPFDPTPPTYDDMSRRLGISSTGPLDLVFSSAEEPVDQLQFIKKHLLPRIRSLVITLRDLATLLPLETMSPMPMIEMLTIIAPTEKTEVQESSNIDGMTIEMTPSMIFARTIPALGSTLKQYRDPYSQSSADELSCLLISLPHLEELEIGFVDELRQTEHFTVQTITFPMMTRFKLSWKYQNKLVFMNSFLSQLALPLLKKLELCVPEGETRDYIVGSEDQHGDLIPGLSSLLRSSPVRELKLERLNFSSDELATVLENVPHLQKLRILNSKEPASFLRLQNRSLETDLCPSLRSLDLDGSNIFATSICHVLRSRLSLQSTQGTDAGDDSAGDDQLKRLESISLRGCTVIGDGVAFTEKMKVLSKDFREICSIVF